MNKDFYNKVCIITGAGSGIGKHIAHFFAKVGAIVAVNDINYDRASIVAEEINKSYKLKNNNVIALKTDVTNNGEVENMVKEVAGKFGTIDILVNNAGILFPTRFENISEEEWDNVINVNLKSVFLCSKAVIPFMKKNKQGRIINISSSAGKTVSTIGGAHYTASKSGVLGLTRAMAKELAQFNIIVNAVCPGLVNTEMVRGTIAKSKIAEYEKSFPISRLCEPEEVAELVLFLASPESSYITGAAIDINGGDLMV
jgi:NAD(P)-dependent dehydrogenase (short-subunit alcohol dehydrogenase family)